MPEKDPRFAILAASARPEVVAALESVVFDGSDAELNRINPLRFAASRGLAEESVIEGFLHATRLGLFELAWNVLCPGCSGVLQTNRTLRTLDHGAYHCALCAAGYEPSLDEMVEVTFTVAPQLRRIAAHDPDRLPLWDYYRQVFWSTGIALDEGGFDELVAEATLDAIELRAGERALLSLTAPEAFLIVFEPVTHSALFLDVRGPPTVTRQAVELVFNRVRAPTGRMVLSPGPLRLLLENRTEARTLPAVWIAGERLHHLLGTRVPFLTAQRLLCNQVFRDIWRTDTLDPDQRLRITSLTFLFTDLRGSTGLYDQVGDLVAFDIVRAHFAQVQAIVVGHGGAVVKTVGDAVMATFPSPDRALAAALAIREAMAGPAAPGGGTLSARIGLHEGPCLAVMLNDRQDYFGQSVNLASRVQGLATGNAIVATEAVLGATGVESLLGERRLQATPMEAALRGLARAPALYRIGD